MILPVGGVHRGTRAALHYARMLSHDVTAVHVSLDPAEADRVRERWQQWGEGVRLVILESPYRELVEPLLQYIEEVAARRQPQELITVVVPQFVPGSWWHNFLHNQTAVWLRLALLFKPGVVVTDVPFHVESARRRGVVRSCPGADGATSFRTWTALEPATEDGHDGYHLDHD